MKNITMIGAAFMLLASVVLADEVTYYSLGTLGASDSDNAGHCYFEKATQVNSMVQGNPYSDCVVPTSSISEGGLSNLIWKVQAVDGKKIVNLNVRMVFSGDSTVNHIKVTYSTSLNGPWTQIVDAYVPGAYSWYDQMTSVSGLNIETCYVRCEVLATWVNHQGSANIWWKGFTLTGTEMLPEITFPDRRNVFTTGENVTICRWPAANPLVYVVKDHLGRLITSVDVAPSDSETMNLGKLTPGFYHIFRDGVEKARFCVVSEGIQGRATHSVAQVDLGRNGNLSIEKTRRVAELCQMAGVRYIRERWAYGWASMEPVQGQYNLQAMTDFMTLEKEYGLQASFVFMGLPSWAGSEYGDDLRDTFTSAKEISRRLSGLTCCWEYWNEEDNWPFGQGPVHRYSSALKVAYLGFRATDPEGDLFKVATGGISTISQAEFIDEMLGNQIGDYFDIYNSHIYMPVSNYAGVYEQHDDLLDRYDLAEREKWITEGGAEIHIDTTVIQPKWQAEYAIPNVDMETAACDVLPDSSRDDVTARLIKSWVYSARYHWSRFFTFCMIYYNEGSRVWGMLAPGLTATSSYAGLATYNDLLGDLDYAGKMSFATGIEGHLFSGQDHNVAILWSQDSMQSFPLAEGETLYSMTGESISKGPGTVQINSNPVFLVNASYTGTLDTISSATDPVAVKSAPSPIVLDFVRTGDDTDWNVNNQRTFILESLGQTITGNLVVYNLSSTGWQGELKVSAPSGWQVSLGSNSVQVPAMGRVVLNVLVISGLQYRSDVQRLMIQTIDGCSCVSVPFVYDEALNINSLDFSSLGKDDPYHSGCSFYQRAQTVRSIIHGTTYSDCVVPTTSISEGGNACLIWKAQAANGQKIDDLQVKLKFSGDSTANHIRVSYSISQDGPWTEMGDAFVPSPYHWYDQTISKTGLSGETYYVKCDVLATWVDHLGGANLWWEGFTLTWDESMIQRTGMPTFSPDGIYLAGPTSITISCQTEGAVIYYTTDGTMPTVASKIYTTPVPVANGTVLKAVAVAANLRPSVVTSVMYKGINGDANVDGRVDVGDLGILAANYGKTSGATWSQGDFNGDGKVDVGDLGILAANYGLGTSGADFNADYAKVFGPTADSNDSDGDDIFDNSNSTICSGLGLPLVLGLALTGLILIRTEE
jgi:hypothetical protein